MDRSRLLMNEIYILKNTSFCWAQYSNKKVEDFFSSVLKLLDTQLKYYPDFSSRKGYKSNKSQIKNLFTNIG